MKPIRFDWAKMKKVQRIHRVLYAIGMGPVVGRIILLITTVGRKTGRKHVTPVQYELIDGKYYIGSARGMKSDWYRNLQANPNVEVQVKSLHFSGCAETITDPKRISDFLDHRLHTHPIMVGMMMKMHGLPMQPSTQQLEELAGTLALVVIQPNKFSKI